MFSRKHILLKYNNITLHMIAHMYFCSLRYGKKHITCFPNFGAARTLYHMYDVNTRYQTRTLFPESDIHTLFPWSLKNLKYTTATNTQISTTPRMQPITMPAIVPPDNPPENAKHRLLNTCLEMSYISRYCFKQYHYLTSYHLSLNDRLGTYERLRYVIVTRPRLRRSVFTKYG